MAARRVFLGSVTFCLLLAFPFAVVAEDHITSNCLLLQESWRAVPVIAGQTVGNIQLSSCVIDDFSTWLELCAPEASPDGGDRITSSPSLLSESWRNISEIAGRITRNFQHFQRFTRGTATWPTFAYRLTFAYRRR